MQGDEAAGSVRVLRKAGKRQRGEGRRFWLLNMPQRSYTEANQLPFLREAVFSSPAPLWLLTTVRSQVSS